MFSKILIANRGEIALRVIKTAQKLGIQTVAIYSDADSNALHVQQADEAYALNGTIAKDSYLHIKKIMAIATQTGVEAIHPGYGFLSENSEFALACQQADIIFIGPSAKAMQLMASKQSAKQSLENTDVPLTPGYHESDQTPKVLAQAAESIGYPVLLKAAAGGGGKGMRRVDNAQAFDQALDGAKREALASFGDDTMIIEKCLINPRHVEMQIIADQHGKVLHCFERDCSIQRRHQKIIEEAPAPNLSETLRNKLSQAAITVAKAIAYENAGTIEFLVDDQENCYFMEMNTRLQVEHPVTELITQLDLVELQFIVASGAPLPIEQSDIQCHGHAIECRIYAEDAFGGGLPSTGKLRVFETPLDHQRADTGTIRLDTGFADGDDISPFYDPMLGKLIAFGPTRQTAAHRLHHALMHYVVGGVKTNIDFVKQLIASPKFKSAELGTDFLSQITCQPPHIDDNMILQFAAAWCYVQWQRQIEPFFQEMMGFSNTTFLSYTHYFEWHEQIHSIHIKPISPCEFKLWIENACHQITISSDLERFAIQLHTSKGSFSAYIQDESSHGTYDRIFWIYHAGACIEVHQRHHPKALLDSEHQQGGLTAPMPATVVALLKSQGDVVKKGEGIIVLEAMKMEHTLCAPQDGLLSELFFTVGNQVQEGTTLAAIVSNNTQASDKAD